MSSTNVDATNQRGQLYTVSGALGIWLLFLAMQWGLWLINTAVSAETVQRYNLLWFVVAGALTIALIIHQKPRILTASNFGLRWLDIPVIALVGYLDANLRFLVLTPPFVLGFHSPPKMMLVIAILPILEEVICRGVVLVSLLPRMHIAWAILMTSVIFAVSHVDFWPALVGELFMSLIYVLRRRSLTASLLYHMFCNTIVWFPKLLLVAHWRHFV